MKKSLFVLPLLASLLLAGCNSGGSSKKKGKSTSEELPAEDCLDFGPETFGDYKRVKGAPKAGKEYYMGFYHIADEQMRFMNGNPHVDSGTTYDYYLGTTDDIANAVKVTCEFASDKVHYALKVVGGGEGTYYDNQYLNIYDGTKDSGAKIVTIEHKTEPVSRFHYEEVYANYRVQTTVIDIEDPREGHEFGLFGCTIPGKEVYRTVSAQDEVNFGNCYVCHFWEHK